jgi:hypothetical protein
MHPMLETERGTAWTETPTSGKKEKPGEVAKKETDEISCP